MRDIGYNLFSDVIKKISIILLCIIVSSSGVIGTDSSERELDGPDATEFNDNAFSTMDISPLVPRSSDEYTLVANSTENDATGGNWARKLARDNAGLLFTAFEDNGEIWISNSSDGGKTWTTPLNMSNTTAGSFAPTITTNGTTIYIAWLESYDVLLRYSTDSGTTWTPALDQAPSLMHNAGSWGLEARHVSLATNGDNTTYLLYTRADWWDEVVTLRRSEDGGQTWSTPFGITNDWYDRASPSIAAEGQYVHVVFSESLWNGEDWDVYYTVSDNHGLDFTYFSALDISRNNADSENPCIAINDTGGASIVWEDEQDGNEDIRYRSTPSRGSSWDPILTGPGTDLSNNTADSLHPTIVMMDEDVWVLWRDVDIHADGDLFYEHYDGTDWNGPVAFTYSTIGHAYPNLNIDPPSSRVEWVWTGLTSANYDIYYDYIGIGGDFPVLNWTGAVGYISDGVDPDEGTTGHYYTFSVNYTDADDDAPETDFPEVWIDRDRDGFYDSSNERATMTESDGSDTDYTDGKEFYYTTEFLEIGLYNYTYRARDDTHSPAWGEPTERHPGPNVTSVNLRPELWWTEETDSYAADGLDPEQGSTGTMFEFRIKYIDGLDEAPAVGFPKVLIDMDDDGDFEGAQDAAASMQEVAENDTTFINGKIYTYSRMFDPGDYSYKFMVEDLVGLINETVVSSGPHVSVTGAKPELSTTMEPNYVDDCVHPDEGFDTTEFTFRVNYSDGDNDPPVVGSVKVGIDLDLDGNITDLERSEMEEVVPQDTTYDDGKMFLYRVALGDIGLYKYEFTAMDTSLAKADPIAFQGPNVTGINSPPRLSWTQEEDYSMDGLKPENGTVEETLFIYRVRYTDIDDDPPMNGSLRVGIDMDRNGTFEMDEFFVMEEVTSTDTVYFDGKFFVYVTTLLDPGDYSYIFEARDAKGVPADGIPTGRHFGPTVMPGANLPPSLSWVGTGAFADRGLNPIEGALNTSFVYQISYMDAEGDAPADGYPVVSIDIDMDGKYEAGESFPMSEEDAEDSDLTNGKVYRFETSFSKPGTNYTYSFDAMDANGVFALGLAGQVFDGPIVILNLPPTLLQVGTVGYQSDFVEPDRALKGTTFTFKVTYRDPEGDEPYNATVWVWIDINMDGIFDEGDVKKAMAEAVPSDIDYTDGKTYLATQLLDEPGTYGHRFYAMDSHWNEPAGPGTAAYIEGPIVEEKVLPPNGPPELVLLGEGDYILDGVDPSGGEVGTEFEFRVRYIDLENDTPAEGQPRLLVDINMDGDFDDPEDINASMVALDSTDLIVNDGKSYYFKLLLEEEGTYNYMFIVVNDMDQSAKLGPFEGPMVTKEPKKVTLPGPGWDVFLPWALLLLIVAIIAGLAIGIAYGRKRADEIEPEKIKEGPPKGRFPEREEDDKVVDDIEDDIKEPSSEPESIDSVGESDPHTPSEEVGESTVETETRAPELETKASETEAPADDSEGDAIVTVSADVDDDISKILGKIDED